MKIGVISDTHIPRRAKKLPSPVLAGFVGVDLILHAGDITGKEVLDDLALIAPVKAVKGNMDMFPLAELLPSKRIVEVGTYRIGLIHGHGMGYNPLQNAKDEFMEAGVDAVVFGHSHEPYNKMHGDCLFFNPGSPTDKRWLPNFSYGILYVKPTEIRGEIIEF